MEFVNISVLRANLLNYLNKDSGGNTLSVTVDRHKATRASLNQLAKSSVLHDVVTPCDERWDAMS